MPFPTDVRDIRPGETVEKVMPHSEVCMHMRVAGKWMKVRLLESGRMCQLYFLDFKPFSSPITIGEAGIFHRDDTFYYYPDLG